jgi:hypothetical protein
MSKQLYEEALADVKRVKEVAEDSAKKAVLEAITPRIRDLIERELLREQDEDFLDEEMPVDDDVAKATDELMLDDVHSDVLDASSMSLPDEEGKVTLDIDSLTVGDSLSGDSQLDSLAGFEEDEYELSTEAIANLANLIDGSSASHKHFEIELHKLGESIARMINASRTIVESQGFKSKIFELSSKLEDMYSYVQESVSDKSKKKLFETKLEKYYQELTKFQETKMQRKRMMTEEDVTLKLTGLPDDVDLESIGVDLITGEDELDDSGDESEDGDLDLDSGEDSESDGDDVELDLDSGDEGDSDSGDELDLGEALGLSDDTVVEIDESVLVKEIARMKKLREMSVPSTKGHSMTSSVLDDFGDGDDEGDPLLDGDVNTLHEMDEMDSSDDLEGEEDEAAQKVESLQRRLQFERKLQQRARVRASKIKNEAKQVRSAAVKKALHAQYNRNAQRFNESVKRANRLRGVLVEAKSAMIENRPNGVSKQLAERSAVKNLREKLAETNLANAKLMYANKLLQSDRLTAKQKQQVVNQLDAAKNVNEAKLVYESVTKALSGTSKTLREGTNRQVLGSSSRAAGMSSTKQTLNEGYETERWAKLAGIEK